MKKSLETWLRDIERAPSDELREACGRALLDDPSVRNDERYVRVWLSLASNVREPTWIFELLDEAQVGHGVALFWVAWAFVAEKAERFAEADELYARGTTCAAAPRDLLARRRREFERRMKRHWLRAASSKETSKETRAPFRVLDESARTDKSDKSRAPLRVLGDNEDHLGTVGKRISRRLVFSTAKRDQPVSHLKRADQDDLTINSAIAAREMDSLFFHDEVPAFDDASMLATKDVDDPPGEPQFSIFVDN